MLCTLSYGNGIRSLYRRFSSCWVNGFNLHNMIIVNAFLLPPLVWNMKTIQIINNVSGIIAQYGSSSWRNVWERWNICTIIRFVKVGQEFIFLRSNFRSWFFKKLRLEFWINWLKKFYASRVSETFHIAFDIPCWTYIRSQVNVVHKWT